MQHFTQLTTSFISVFLFVETQGYDYDGQTDYDCYYSGKLGNVPKEDLWKPRCDTIVGDFTIDSTSNLTEGDLEKLFRNITTIYGRVLVEKTNLQRLTFLENVVALNTFYSSHVLEVINNPFLTQINLAKWNFSDGMVTIQRNPLLNVSKLCAQIDRITSSHWSISRNKMDCGGFQLDFPLTFTSILNVPPNLTTIRGDLILEETAIPLDRLAVLSSVKKIMGCVTVWKTNLETLSFLGNLEEINCGNKRQPALSIFFNNFLINLGLPKLTLIRTTLPIEAQNNRVLKIGFNEIDALVSTGVPATQFNGMFPTDDLPAGTCAFNSLTDDLTTLDLNCTNLVGLLYYEQRSFSEPEVKTLIRIRKIYGNIDLVNVDIDDLSMFSSLEQVITLNKTAAAIQLTSISTLKSIKMPNLKLVYAPSALKFSIDNCPNINFTQTDCEIMEKISHNALVINNKFCDEWFEDETTAPETS